MIRVNIGSNENNINRVKETLTRMGIANKEKKILYPTCYLYRTNGQWFLAHFKELFAINRKDYYNGMTKNDELRRNAITFCLKQWGLLDCKDSDIEEHEIYIYIIKYVDKHKWLIYPKFNILSIPEENR